ncbi:MAG: hypothetical protein K2X08_07325, partial [Chlamydiales bacterium]|nr:hypothetical protein [Chlamydiales bacterium]
MTFQKLVEQGFLLRALFVCHSIMYDLFELFRDLKNSKATLLKEKDAFKAIEQETGEISKRNASNVCSVCPLALFDTVAEFRNHYKTEWHRYNIINVNQKKRAIPLNDFENMKPGNNISETEEEAEVFIPNLKEIFIEINGANYQLILYQKLLGSEISSSDALSAQIESIINSTWCIFLIRSGRVSLGVFNNKTRSLLVSKSDKWYTTRKKSGGSQSKRDNTGNGTRSSVGAILRRENEKAMKETVQ